MRRSALTEVIVYKHFPLCQMTWLIWHDNNVPVAPRLWSLKLVYFDLISSTTIKRKCKLNRYNFFYWIRCAQLRVQLIVMFLYDFHDRYFSNMKSRGRVWSRKKLFIRSKYSQFILDAFYMDDDDVDMCDVASFDSGTFRLLRSFPVPSLPS